MNDLLKLKLVIQKGDVGVAEQILEKMIVELDDTLSKSSIKIKAKTLNGKKLAILDLDDIVYAETNGRYTYLIKINGEKFVTLDQTLREICNNYQTLSRASRTIAVNANHVEGILKTETGFIAELKYELGPIRLSRRGERTVRQAMLLDLSK